MLKNRNKSILFHNPDYHCTFFYRKELLNLGWRADIFVFDTYPDKLLFSSENVIKSYRITKNLYLDYTLWYLCNFFKYKYIFYYGRPIDYGRILKKFGIKVNFEPMLFLIKLFGTKIIYLPTGCNDEFTRKQFLQFDNGNVCNNCGIFEKCNDIKNLRNLEIINKYANLVIGTGFTKPQIKNLKNMRWKSFDLEVYNSKIRIPSEFQLAKTNSFRILHATSLELRDFNGKNIKGSPYIEDAVMRLKSEGYNCELIRLKNVPSKYVRFYQAQADLIIDQLIYGHWGSSALEGIALGKPVVCYLNREMKNQYKKTFKVDQLPIIEANIHNIYEILKSLLENPNIVSEYSDLSVDFAKKYLDVKINVHALVAKLESL